MKLKYGPCKWNPYAASNFPDTTKPDTEAAVSGANMLVIDGVEYEFDADSVEFPDIHEQTGGAIIEAHRESGELFVTIRRFYTGSPCMDDCQYHEVTE